MSRLALAAAITLLGWPVAAEPNAQRSHADEIQAYAAVMAMAQTASDRCADILVSNAMIDKAPTSSMSLPETTRLIFSPPGSR